MPMGAGTFRRHGRGMQIGNGQLEVRNENVLATLTLRGDLDIANVAVLVAGVPVHEPFELVEG